MFLTGSGAPSCSVGNLGNAYIDVLNGDLYYKIAQPVAPTARSVPAVTGSTHHVGSAQLFPYDTVQNAINAASTLIGDSLFLDDATYTITSTITVNKSITIEGQGAASTTLQMPDPGVNIMINITAPNVIIKNVKIIHNLSLPASTATAISINNSIATGIYIDNCTISPCEFGIGIKAAEFQISNCSFTYAPVTPAANSYRYIAIYNSSGVSIIDNNTFVSDSGNSRCYFIAVTNVAVSSGFFQGQLLISNNTQAVSPFTLRHLFDMEEFIGSGLQLFFINNTTISEGNVPILLYGGNLSIFRFIDAIGNNVQNTVGKGLIGIDNGYIGTTDIYSSNNVLANPSFTAPWASATVPSSSIVGYDTSVIPTNPSLPFATCYWLLLK